VTQPHLDCAGVDEVAPCKLLWIAYGSLPELSLAELTKKGINMPTKLYRLMRGDGDDTKMDISAFEQALRASESAKGRAASILYSVDDGSTWKQDYLSWTSDKTKILTWLVESRKLGNKRR